VLDTQSLRSDFLIQESPLFRSIVLMFRLSAAARIALVCMDWLASGQSGEFSDLADPRCLQSRCQIKHQRLDENEIDE
jgi:hypothetical protein